jgi:hypothetical protein
MKTLNGIVKKANDLADFRPPRVILAAYAKHMQLERRVRIYGRAGRVVGDRAS